MLSSSSWGCELKCECFNHIFKQPCHPLREDVSWNITAYSFITKQIMSSSSWGCELKYLGTPPDENCTGSHPLREDVSWNNSVPLYWKKKGGHPLREDVSWNIDSFDSSTISLSHPLREDVSWNVQCQRIFLSGAKSSSSWGCELKYYETDYGSDRLSHPLREDVSWNAKIYKKKFKRPVILFVRMWVEIFVVGCVSL